jgi:hypothetical protein
MIKPSARPVTDADDLAGLYGTALKQQDAVTTAIADLAKERVQLSATIEALQNTSGGLQKAAGDAAAKAVTETLGKAPKTAQTVLNTVTDALNIAASYGHVPSGHRVHKQQPRERKQSQRLPPVI